MGTTPRFFPARLRLHPRRKACPPVPPVLLLLLLVLLFFVLSPQISIGAPDHAKDKDKEKPYALIAGTVWGPDDHPIYGIKVKLRRGKDKPGKARWEMISDHNGEFAQRVPPGESDYVVWADLKGVKFTDGSHLHAPEVTVHIYNDEREDTGLHLTRQDVAPSRP